MHWTVKPTVKLKTTPNVLYHRNDSRYNVLIHDLYGQVKDQSQLMANNCKVLHRNSIHPWDGKHAKIYYVKLICEPLTLPQYLSPLPPPPML